MSTAPSDVAIAFDDASAYESFMGRWSRAAGTTFLDWLAPPQAARWLEIGCGTGAFTELVLRQCSPSSMIALDPAITQIEYCRSRSISQHIEFRVADARALPFAGASFDVITHALVLNFIPDMLGALREMRRVGHHGSLMGGYVWDFSAERAPNSCVALGLRQIGCTVPRMPGAEKSTLNSLYVLFERTGFKEIGVTSFDVKMTFLDFDEFWRSQIPSFSPLSAIINALSHADRMKLTDAVQARLEIDADGRICSTARANAIRAGVP